MISEALPATREDIATLKMQFPALSKTFDEMIADKEIAIVENKDGVSNVNNSSKNRN